MTEGLDPAVADEYRRPLAEIARRIADQAIGIAMASGGDPNKIEDALTYLDDGDQSFGTGDFERAVDAYEDAAQEAETAWI